MVFVCHVTLQDHMIQLFYDFTVWSSSRKVPRHHPVRLGGHSHCSSGNKIVLICYMISQDHVMKGSCDFMGRRPSW